MGARWNPLGFQLPCYFLFLILSLQIRHCLSLNSEGFALLKFRDKVDLDPYGALANWTTDDDDPCEWLGVHCVDGEVQKLDLTGFSLEGLLAPELGKLSQLRSLILYQNHFYGAIPVEIGDLIMLQVLDLRGNNLTGTIPAEINKMVSLKFLWLAGNKLEGTILMRLEELNVPSKIQSDENFTFDVTAGKGCLNRKVGLCIWQSRWKRLNKAGSFFCPMKGALLRCLNILGFPQFRFAKDSPHGPRGNLIDDIAEPEMVLNTQNGFSSRRKLLEQSSNLAAIPVDVGSLPSEITTVPITRSSGSFPAVPDGKKKQSAAPLAPPPSLASPHSQNSSEPNTKSSQTTNTDSSPSGLSGAARRYIIIIVPSVAVLLIIFAFMLIFCRKRGVASIGPWKTGLSGQLQKAFITGVPKLNRSELEAACEDFSNIVSTTPACTVYKGTLSSGVEIAVTTATTISSKDWSASAEKAYRKKIDMLSRVNHKNFVNLIGYCEEDEPFTRMMVFEYAPNGQLSEHLHVKEAEHLDWITRVRIVMGIAYCLHYMHHDLNPPVAHTHLTTSSIYLTDDYAAKVAEVFWSGFLTNSKNDEDDKSEHSELPPPADPETDVYNFGVMLLEIISGKPLYSDEQGPLVDWASQYLYDKKSTGCLIDPTLKNFKNNELDIICEIIIDCIKPDPRQRPAMREITGRLRDVIAISPDQATPRLSPLWWAELEILSVEAT
ncbi:protein MALE DISCOVERER 2 isoform X1 [Rhodamnia argentea]|uniref:Protein MALE DISCOVERER 2 isoform X1 n=1 Tax=Rhodamnia argentea TaxID=178133 RepID=A0A8B8QPK7_9MYRT|nr:protein MALE DISCOVERER 2 isoform X1 [Rhodamnia argentea]XP_048132506.1 protein MALE DISCOVERER 2 isoform X1 [Rhodamnia argentea]